MSGADGGLVTGTTSRRTYNTFGLLVSGAERFEVDWAAALQEEGGLKMFSKRILMAVAALLTAGSFLLSDVGSSVAMARDGRGGWRGGRGGWGGRGWNGGWRGGRGWGWGGVGVGVYPYGGYGYPYYGYGYGYPAYYGTYSYPYYGNYGYSYPYYGGYTTGYSPYYGTYGY
jgi:hypothetical protein